MVLLLKVMLQTKFKNENEQRAITPNLMPRVMVLEHCTSQ